MTKRIGPYMVLLLVILMFSSIAGAVNIPAFPGAEGGGAAAIGGRSGTVIEVTNLNDSGTGSLRAALTASGPRIVVFRVAGIINLQTPIRITNPYVTVAGQTAPGGGITLKGADLTEYFMIGIRTHDIVIRYIRFRYGYSDLNPPGSQRGKIFDTIGGVYNVIFDHCSFSWAADENMTLWTMNDTEYERFTVQYSISSEGLAGHAAGYIAGAQYRSTADKITDIDVHHSFFAHNQNRNPLMKIKSAQVINNIVYNWEWYGSGWEGGATVDFIGNVYKAGASTPAQPEIFWLPNLDGPTGNPSIYVEGNKGPTNPNGTGDNWAMVCECEGGTWSCYGDHPSTSYRRYSPLQVAYPITIYNANELEGILLNNVGASHRLNEYGASVPNRDSVDTRVINNYINGTGDLIASEDEVGGFPIIDSGTPYEDSDHDGMPNMWELMYGLDPYDNSDASGDPDGDGYTNIEEFLNETVPGAAPGSCSCCCTCTP